MMMENPLNVPEPPVVTTTWFTFYSHRKKREYYYEPISGRTTWVAPTDGVISRLPGSPEDEDDEVEVDGEQTKNKRGLLQRVLSFLAKLFTFAVLSLLLLTLLLLATAWMIEEHPNSLLRQLTSTTAVPPTPAWVYSSSLSHWVHDNLLLLTSTSNNNTQQGAEEDAVVAEVGKQNNAEEERASSNPFSSFANIKPDEDNDDIVAVETPVEEQAIIMGRGEELSDGEHNGSEIREVEKDDNPFVATPQEEEGDNSNYNNAAEEAASDAEWRGLLDENPQYHHHQEGSNLHDDMNRHNSNDSEQSVEASKFVASEKRRGEEYARDAGMANNGGWHDGDGVQPDQEKDDVTKEHHAGDDATTTEIEFDHQHEMEMKGVEWDASEESGNSDHIATSPYSVDEEDLDEADISNFVSEALHKNDDDSLAGIESIEGQGGVQLGDDRLTQSLRNEQNNKRASANNADTDKDIKVTFDNVADPNVVSNSPGTSAGHPEDSLEPLDSALDSDALINDVDKPSEIAVQSEIELNSKTYDHSIVESSGDEDKEKTDAGVHEGTIAPEDGESSIKLRSNSLPEDQETQAATSRNAVEHETYDFTDEYTSDVAQEVEELSETMNDVVRPISYDDILGSISDALGRGEALMAKIRQDAEKFGVELDLEPIIETKEQQQEPTGS